MLVIVGPSQGSKTAGMLMRLAWSIANRPGPKLWLTADDDLAKDASQERIQPTLDRCPDLEGLLLDNRLDKTNWKIRTKLCTLDVAGAKGDVVLQQNPYEEVYCDEARNYRPGLLQMVEKRQRSYEEPKTFVFTSAGKVNDELDVFYKQGTCFEWAFPCMGCGKEMLLNWKAVKYGEQRNDGNGKAGLEGLSEGVEAVAVICQSCGHRHSDVPNVRRAILEKGHWTQTNLAPTQGVVSYHWNALLPPWIHWADLVAEWKRANAQKKLGNIEPLKVFVTETLAEPWEERVEQADYAALIERSNGTGYLCPEARRNVWLAGSMVDNKFVASESWKHEKRKLLMVDVQQEVKYFDIRAWGLGGISRLVGYGKVFTFEDIREIQQELKIKDGDVGVDEGYLPAEVRQACLRYGWKAMKGVEQEYFSHEFPDPNKPGQTTKIRRLWTMSRSDPYIGKQNSGRVTVPLVLFSVSGINEMLEYFMTGKGPLYEFPMDTQEDYFRQLAAVKPMPDPKKPGRIIFKQVARDDHFRDTSKESLVAAICLGLVGSSEPTLKPTSAPLNLMAEGYSNQRRAYE
jgi:hypothetical protein